MNDDEIRHFRAVHAADVCTCGHARRDHYADDGATVGCFTAGCVCPAYALAHDPKEE